MERKGRQGTRAFHSPVSFFVCHLGSLKAKMAERQGKRDNLKSMAAMLGAELDEVWVPYAPLFDE